MERKLNVIVCKGCRKDNRITLSSEQEKVYCYNCGELIFSREVARNSAEGADGAASGLKPPRKKASSLWLERLKKWKLKLFWWAIGLFLVIYIVDFSGEGVSAAVPIAQAVGVGAAVFIVFGLIYVLLDASTKRCYQCKGTNVTEYYTDSAEGTTTMLKSRAIRNDDLKVVDRRYYDQLVEYGTRTTRTTCLDCGYTKVVKSQYKRDR